MNLRSLIEGPWNLFDREICRIFIYISRAPRDRTRLAIAVIYIWACGFNSHRARGEVLTPEPFAIH